MTEYEKKKKLLVSEQRLTAEWTKSSGILKIATTKNG